MLLWLLHGRLLNLRLSSRRRVLLLLLLLLAAGPRWRVENDIDRHAAPRTRQGAEKRVLPKQSINGGKRRRKKDQEMKRYYIEIFQPDISRHCRTEKPRQQQAGDVPQRPLLLCCLRRAVAATYDGWPSACCRYKSNDHERSRNGILLDVRSSAAYGGCCVWRLLHSADGAGFVASCCSLLLLCWLLLLRVLLPSTARCNNSR